MKEDGRFREGNVLAVARPTLAVELFAIRSLGETGVFARYRRRGKNGGEQSQIDAELRL
jgi:hypothetical protein